MLSAKSASRSSSADSAAPSSVRLDRSQTAPMMSTCTTDWLAEALDRPAVSKFVEVDGAQIHYLNWGNGQPDKPVLVLLHGLRGHAHWWDAVAPSFAEEYRVIAPDLSGMGESAYRQQYTGGVYARDLIGVMTAECSEPAVVVGHSYGGSRVIQAYTMAPELFRRIILVDTFVALDGEDLPEDSSRPSHRVYPDLAQALARFRLLPDQPADPRILDHLARRSLSAVEGGFSWKFDPNLPAVRLREGNVEKLLSEISIPVDYICGQRSALVDSSRARRIVQRLPFGRGPIVIPDGHHHLMLDQPIALVSALRALLAGPS